MNIVEHAAVSIHYTLKNDAGETLDSSEGQEPLTFLQGHENIIAGLEKEIEGKTVGDKIKAVIAPEDGYGPRVDDLVQDVPKAQFDQAEEIKVGARFQVQAEDGVMIACVTAIEGDTVKVDLNHPLAGMTLHFDVEVTDVREATEDELAHGHVHGAGCDHDH